MLPTHLRPPLLKSFLAPSISINFTGFLKKYFIKKLKNDLATHLKNLGPRYCKPVFLKGCLTCKSSLDIHDSIADFIKIFLEVAQLWIFFDAFTALIKLSDSFDYDIR